jgi:MFS family permease
MPSARPLLQPAYDRLGGLWLQRDFRLLWGSLTVTHFGGQVTFLALPLTAALLLNATPTQMGILTALEVLPFCLFGLLSGVLVDHVRRLPLIIFSDLLRGAVLLSVPIAAWLNALSMPLLYAVGFLVGCGGVVGWPAYQVFMTSRVGRHNLVEANSKIALSESSAQLVGPGMAGLFIQWLTAPIAILLDALAFFFSAWMLRGIAPQSSDTEHLGQPHQPLLELVRQGLRLILDNPFLRHLAWTMALWNLLRHLYLAIVILYATRELGLGPGMLGAVWMAGGIACIVMTFYAARCNGRFGFGRCMLAGMLGTGVTWGMMAAAPASSHWGAFATAAVLGLAIFVYDLGGTMFFINYLSLRQAVTPDHLLGRVVSTMIFLSTTTGPLGSLVGGLLAEWIGFRPTFFMIACACVLIVALVSRISGLGQLRELPPSPNAT